jgi:hypothetical protein
MLIEGKGYTGWRQRGLGIIKANDEMSGNSCSALITTVITNTIAAFADGLTDGFAGATDVKGYIKLSASCLLPSISLL